MSTASRIAGFFLWCGVLVVFPHDAAAQVVISEIAWMGTTADANDEWIELHNRGGDPVDVTGWTIDDGDALFVTLTGSIASHGFALLERTDDNSVASVSAFQIYTGALSNAGKTITLRNGSAAKIDTAVGGENWTGIGGNNVSKDTPQRTGSEGWVTAAPTPGSTNASNGVPQDTSTDTSSTPTPQSSGSTAGGKVAYGAPKPPPQKPDQLALAIRAPGVAYVNQSVDFKLEATGPGKTILSSLAYDWNFGDTFTSTEKEPTHAFLYPGEYTVVVDGAYAKQSAQTRHEVTVLPVSFTLSRGTQGELLLSNHSSEETDIGGFTLQSATSFIFPKHTIIKAGGVLTIPATRVGSGQGAVLRDATHVHVASLESPQVVRAIPTQRTMPATVIAYKEPAPEVSKPQEPAIPTGVIRIGGDISDTESGNAVTRFFKKLRGIFSSN